MPVRTSTPVTEDERSTTNLHDSVMDVFAQLREFRQAAYQCLCRAKDATFELMDAILLTRNAYSLADLSMCPVFRRQWPSIYEAIQDTRPQRHKLMRLYIKNIPKQERIILAGDHTVWSRPDAPTLRERTYEHYTTGGRGGRPITLGYGYSTIAWIPETEGSWALPLRHERITSWENPIDKAVWQLKQVCQDLPSRPITLWDGSNASESEMAELGGLARDIVSDNPLPWQKQMSVLTPGRVAQAMPGILLRVSTPAQAPKPRGKSPGWKTGQHRQRRTRYPIVKKRTSSSRKVQPKTA